MRISQGQEKVTIITATGDRPLAFRLCEKYVATTRFEGDIQWIVVDDGAEPTKMKLGQQYIRRDPVAGVFPTLGQNLQVAIQHVRHDKVLIIEDDDWYDSGYISYMTEKLNHYDLVGQAYSRMYHLMQSRFFINDNDKHAAFFQTALRGYALAKLYDLCVESPQTKFFDLALWKQDLKKHVFTDASGAVGIKGMPGRAGISQPHSDCSWYHEDRNNAVLLEWLGQDADEYLTLRENLIRTKRNRWSQ